MIGVRTMHGHWLVPVSKALDDLAEATLWRCFICDRRGDWRQMETSECEVPA